MTYNEKKSLYESIMKDVAKIIKRQINEEKKLYYPPLDKNNLHKIGEFVNEIYDDYPEAGLLILNIIKLFRDTNLSKKDMLKEFGELEDKWWHRRPNTI